MTKSDPAAPGVRNALAAAEASCPGISLELALAIIKKSELNVGLNEAILRLQGTPDDHEGIAIRVRLLNVISASSMGIQLLYSTSIASSFRIPDNPE